MTYETKDDATAETNDLLTRFAKMHQAWALQYPESYTLRISTYMVLRALAKAFHLNDYTEQIRKVADEKSDSIQLTMTTASAIRAKSGKVLKA